MVISGFENATLGLFQVYYLWVKKFQFNFKKLHNAQMKVYKRVILSDSKRAHLKVAVSREKK